MMEEPSQVPVVLYDPQSSTKSYIPMIEEDDAESQFVFEEDLKAEEE
jgi:hypothetical protein